MSAEVEESCSNRQHGDTGRWSVQRSGWAAGAEPDRSSLPFRRSAAAARLGGFAESRALEL